MPRSGLIISSFISWSSHMIKHAWCQILWYQFAIWKSTFYDNMHSVVVVVDMFLWSLEITYHTSPTLLQIKCIFGIVHNFCLTHWGRVTHICIGNLTIIVSDNGLSPGRRQAIFWTIAGILLILTLGTNSSGIVGEIHSFIFSKMHLKMLSARWRLFGLSLNVLKINLSWSNWLNNAYIRKWTSSWSSVGKVMAWNISSAKPLFKPIPVIIVTA